MFIVQGQVFDHLQVGEPLLAPPLPLSECWTVIVTPVLSLSDPRSRQRLASCLISQARNLDTRHPTSGWDPVRSPGNVITLADIKELDVVQRSHLLVMNIAQFHFSFDAPQICQMGGGCFHLQKYSPGSWSFADEAISGPWASEQWPYLGWVRTSDTSVSSNYQTPRPVTSG